MGNYKLSLMSKRLKSGKCQIKFSVCDLDTEVAYGYLLSEAQTTLREVVGKIEQKVRVSIDGDRLYHPHLYNLQQRKMENDVVIFKQ